MLMMENTTTINNAHQLQMMGATLGGSYTVANNIDLSSGLANLSEVWETNSNTLTGTGFSPVGNATTPFVGSFNGGGYTINGLYINRPSTDYQALFGENNVAPLITNVTMTNANVTGNNFVGALIGLVTANGTPTITNAYVMSGQITGYQYVGGLIGAGYTGTYTNLGASNNVTGTKHSIGGLFGKYGNGSGNNPHITNSYAVGGTVTGLANSYYIGGFAGWAGGWNGVTSSVYSANTVIGMNGTSNVGGFAGYHMEETVSNAYSTSSVTINGSGTNIGGFIGLANTSSIVQKSYSSGAVTVTGTGTNVGGFSGFVNTADGSLNCTDCFWDTTTSGQATSADGTGMTTAQMQSLATFTGASWSMTSTPSATGTAPANTWFIFEGQTRPMLMMENSSTISTPHQLQMMGAALGGSYTLSSNIDLTSAMNNTSEVWGTNAGSLSGAGFIPVGGSSNFTGSLNGNNYYINYLYIKATSGNSGLFSNINTSGTISNVRLTNVNISNTSGTDYTGALAGQADGTFTISNIMSSGTVSVCGGR